MQIGVANLLLGDDIRRSMRIRQKWARTLLPTLGIKLQVQGNLPTYPCLLVANHRSYLDPILIIRDLDVYPVAKAEIADWPLIGKGAQMAGILYLKREQHGSRVGTLKQMLDRIKSDFSVLIFPEGTTSDHQDTLPFSKGGFKMAAQNNIPVVPVAIVYEAPADYWVGNATFLGHARKRFAADEIKVDVHYGQEIVETDSDLLQQQAQAWINSTLKKHPIKVV
ncbi:MAG TPA: hypothetical protein DCF33_02065 [Saprospirales bacterium]|nr:hypothetical protein [Saprospirales bacterium]